METEEDLLKKERELINIQTKSSESLKSSLKILSDCHVEFKLSKTDCNLSVFDSINE